MTDVNGVKSGQGAGAHKKVPLIYILAASHSGSTLLAMLLNAHPDICTVGELKATSFGDAQSYRCSCRRLIAECSFWNGIQMDMKGVGREFRVTDAKTDIRDGVSTYARRLLRPLFRNAAWEFVRDTLLNLDPNWPEHCERVQSQNTALMRAVLSRSGKHIIVDSSKIGIRLKYLLRNPDIDVKVLRLVRDGRAVALTYVDPERFADATDPKLRGGGSGSSRDAERMPMSHAAMVWRRSNEEAEAMLKALPRDRWLEVRYEDVCSRTEAAMGEIFSFVGADPVSWRRDFRTAEHHVVGNGMRLDSTSEVRLDERWKTQLAGADIEAFEKAAGKMNRRLGYR